MSNEPWVDKCKRFVRENLQAVSAGLLMRIIVSSSLSLNIWEFFVENLVRFGGSDSSVNMLFEMIDTKFIFWPLLRYIDNKGMRSVNLCYCESNRLIIYRSRLVEIVYSCATQRPVGDQVRLYERLALRNIEHWDEMLVAVHKLGKIGDFPAIRSLERVIQQSQHDKVVRYAKDVLNDLSTPAAACIAAHKLELARQSYDEWEQFTKCRTARAIFHDGKRIHGQTYTVLVDAFNRVINDPNVDERTRFIAAAALDRQDIFCKTGIKIARTQLDERVM